MGNVRVIDVHQSVYAVNDEIAAKTRARLKEEKTFMVNLMSSPGAGKTTTLISCLLYTSDAADEL